VRTPSPGRPSLDLAGGVGLRSVDLGERGVGEVVGRARETANFPDLKGLVA
jgi:hypothetical protein